MAQLIVAFAVPVVAIFVVVGLVLRRAGSGQKRSARGRGAASGGAWSMPSDGGSSGGGHHGGHHGGGSGCSGGNSGCSGGSSGCGGGGGSGCGGGGG